MDIGCEPEFRGIRTESAAEFRPTVELNRSSLQKCCPTSMFKQLSGRTKLKSSWTMDIGRRPEFGGIQTESADKIRPPSEYKPIPTIQGQVT